LRSILQAGLFLFGDGNSVVSAPAFPAPQGSVRCIVIVVAASRFPQQQQQHLKVAGVVVVLCFNSFPRCSCCVSTPPPLDGGGGSGGVRPTTGKFAQGSLRSRFGKICSRQLHQSRVLLLLLRSWYRRRTRR
jgi:hypothetical protein